MLAAQHDGADAIRFLVAHGANINEQNNDGNTALWMAVVQKQNAAIAALLELKADVNITNNLGISVKGYFDRH